MPDTEKIFVICHTTKVLPKPYVPSRNIDCMDCGVTLWLSLSMPLYYRGICITCYTKRVKNEDAALPIIGPEVRKELEEMGMADTAIEALHSLIRDMFSQGKEEPH